MTIRKGNALAQMMRSGNELYEQFLFADRQLDCFEPGTAQYTAWFKLMMHFHRAYLQSNREIAAAVL